MTKNGKKYYVDQKTNYRKGWLDISGNRYYMDPSTGALQTGGWMKDGQWYLMSEEDGRMLKGWQKYGNDWYYLDEHTGVMKANRWLHEPHSGMVYRARGWGEQSLPSTSDRRVHGSV